MVVGGAKHLGSDYFRQCKSCFFIFSVVSSYILVRGDPDTSPPTGNCHACLITVSVGPHSTLHGFIMVNHHSYI